MSVKISFIMCYVVLETARAASVYDQSQTGNLNVQIDLKDLQVIALTKSGKEEYVDYDYAYDYSEMTIKPQNGSTPKPLKVSSTTAADISKENATIATVTVYAETTTAESIKNITGKPLEVETVTENPTPDKSTTAKSVYYNKNTKHTTKKSETTVALTAPLTNTTACNRGFVLCDSQQQNKPLSILELLSQRFKRREHRKKSDKE